MKKIILLVFMSIAVTTTLFSQIKFIPKAGVTFSTIHISDNLKSPSEDIKSKIGFVLGVAAEIPLIGKTLSFQPELLFQQNGFKFKDKGDGEYTEEGSTTLNYISLPLLAKVKFGKFYAIAGPSFGFGIGGKSKYTYTDLLQGTTTETENKVKFGKMPDNYTGDDDYLDNVLDVGLQLGVGAHISVLVIDLRYGIGLTNLMDKPDGFTEDFTLKNNSWQLTVGFPLGGKE